MALRLGRVVALAGSLAVWPALSFAASPGPSTIVVRPNQPALGSPNKPDRNAHLMARAKQAMKDLDIVSARRFLMLPAEQGHSEASRRMAETYDPVWLVRAGVMNPQLFANPEQSFEWYKKAYQEGDIEPGNRYVESISQAGK